MSVYTKLDEASVQSILHDYHLGELKNYSAITAGVENTNYFVTCEGGEFVLTIFEKISPQYTFAYLQLMQQLQNYIPCPAPQLRHDQQLLGNWQNKPLAIVAYLDGEHIDNPSAQHCTEVGTALAKLHTAPITTNTPLHNRRNNDWRESVRHRVMAILEPQQQSLLNAEFNCYQQIDFSLLPKGIIHADLFPDNVLFKGSKLSGILDFYDSCYESLLYDVAISVNAWCRTVNGELDQPRSTALLTAYQQIRPWSDIEQQSWPLMLRYAAMRFWLGRLEYRLQAQQGHPVPYRDPKVYQQMLEQDQNLAGLSI